MNYFLGVILKYIIGGPVLVFFLIFGIAKLGVFFWPVLGILLAIAVAWKRGYMRRGVKK